MYILSKVSLLPRLIGYYIGKVLFCILCRCGQKINMREQSMNHISLKEDKM